MFAVINGRQKQVSRSRIYDLLGYMPIKDPAMKERAYKGEMAIHRLLPSRRTGPEHIDEIALA